ncbi:MAG: hypothetical protein AB7E80_05415 [Hyphomicrobiaceae bacterium]
MSKLRIRRQPHATRARNIRGFARDAMIAFAMFALVGTAILANGTAAATGYDRPVAVLVLSLVFSAAMAFNLAFLRHLSRVYASPRRGGGGRN